MFIEPLISSESNRGWIEVISGPMFSGKTEELIRRSKRVKIAKKKVAIFKPIIDERYSKEKIVSHDLSSIESIRIKRAIEIMDYKDDAEVIGVDEAQFFNKAIVNVIQDLAIAGKRVIIAGLDMDSTGKPFGSMPSLLAVAEYVTKLHSICIKCGSLAIHSFRMVKDKKDIIFVGGLNEYEPRCRKCFNIDFRE